MRSTPTEVAKSIWNDAIAILKRWAPDAPALLEEPDKRGRNSFVRKGQDKLSASCVTIHVVCDRVP